jgi:hypothetical protein
MDNTLLPPCSPKILLPCHSQFRRDFFQTVPLPKNLTRATRPSHRRQADSAIGSGVTALHLVLFSSDSALLDKLSTFSKELSYIGFEVGQGPQVAAKAHLDAFWATLTVGVELFGAVPPFPLHEARVLRTPQTQVQRGLPRYGVVGVAVSPDDPRTPEFNLRLVLSSLLRAITEFNTCNPDQILRVGILPDDLELRKLDPAIAFRLVKEVYEQHQ